MAAKASGSKPGVHKLALRASMRKHRRAAGFGCRILAITMVVHRSWTWVIAGWSLCSPFCAQLLHYDVQGNHQKL
jgi:hypothetical protein